MAGTILQGVIRRADHIRSLTDLAKDEAPPAAAFLDITEGLRSCVLLRDFLTEAFKLQWKEAIENQVEDYNSTGRLCLQAFDIVLLMFKTIRARAEQVRVAAVTQDVAPQFGEAARAFEQADVDVTAMRDDFAKRWPWFDQDKLLRSVATERHGVRRRSVQEVHDELRSRVRS